MRDYQENFERAIRIDWERMKRRVFEELGQYKPSLRTTGMDTASYIGTPYAQRVLTTPGGMTPSRAPVETPLVCFKDYCFGSRLAFVHCLINFCCSFV